MAQAPSTVSSRPLSAATNRVSVPFLRVRERRLLLAAVDFGIVFFTILTAYGLWKARVHPAADNMASTPWFWIIGGAAAWLTISWLAGSYELEVADRLAAGAKRTFGVAVCSAGSGLAAYSVFVKTYPRPALAVALVSAPMAVMLWRAIYATTLRRPVGATRVLVLGQRPAYDVLFNAASSHRNYFRFVGYMPTDEVDAGGIGDPEALNDIIDHHGVHQVIVAPRLVLSDSVMAALTRAIERGIDVVDFNSAYEELAGKVAVEHAGDQWLAALPTRPQTSSLDEVAMRLLDVAGSVVGLLLTAGMFPFLALAILSSSRGPLFYVQERVGRGGRSFKIIKLRSMRVGAESDGAQWAALNDDRATSVGRFLRRTHFDELPQFWNILKGEMSLVGPRPERPGFTDELSQSIPFYRLRLSVRPGLTGQKQIKVGYASTAEQHLEVLRHDLYYIKHRSLTLNLAIMARTLGSVLSWDGR